MLVERTIEHPSIEGMLKMEGLFEGAIRSITRTVVRLETMKKGARSRYHTGHVTRIRSKKEWIVPIVLISIVG